MPCRHAHPDVHHVPRSHLVLVCLIRAEASQEDSQHAKMSDTGKLVGCKTTAFHFLADARSQPLGVYQYDT